MRNFKNTNKNVTAAATEECLMSNLQERIDRRVAEARDRIENEEVEKTTDLKATPAETAIAVTAYIGAMTAICAVSYGTTYAAAKILPPAVKKVKKLLCFTRDKTKKAFSSTNSSYSKISNEDHCIENVKAYMEALDQLEELIQIELTTSKGEYTPEITELIRKYKSIGKEFDALVDELGGVVRTVAQ